MLQYVAIFAGNAALSHVAGSIRARCGGITLSGRNFRGEMERSRCPQFSSCAGQRSTVSPPNSCASCYSVANECPQRTKIDWERFSHTHQASDFRVGFVDLPVTYRFFTFNHLCHLPDNHRLSPPTYEPWSAHEPRLQNHFTPNNTPPANSLTFSTSSQATPSKSSPWTGRKPLAGLRTRHASLPSFDPNDRRDASAIYRQNRAVRCPRCRPSPPLLRHQSHSLPPDRLLAAGSAAGAPASWLLRHMKATSTRRLLPTCEFQ